MMALEKQASESFFVPRTQIWLKRSYKVEVETFLLRKVSTFATLLYCISYIYEKWSDYIY